MANSIEVILNAGSGSKRASEMKQILERVLSESGRSFGISILKGQAIVCAAEEKAASDCDLLVAGGGDGTICTVGQAALKMGKTLGVLPLGTFNYFARDLRIPLELEAAARVLLEGSCIRAPMLDLDGRLILNNASIGIHPEVLLRRRKLYQRWGRNQFNSYLSVLLSAFQPPPRLRVRLRTETGEVVYETPMVMVCSNGFQMETFALEGKECLNAGRFALYVARMAGRATILRLGGRAIVRRLRTGIDYEAICVSEVTIETRRRRLRAALDGELEEVKSPMHFRLASKQLVVLAPRNERTSQGECFNGAPRSLSKPSN
jgi:diacylglycerol kinase family enzyme